MSTTPAQPTRSVKIYRTDSLTYLRFIGDTADEANKSTTFVVNADGTVQFYRSEGDQTVNYVKGMTADPKVLKRIWTDTGTSLAQVQINAENNPAASVNIQATNTTQASSAEVNMVAGTLQASASQSGVGQSTLVMTPSIAGFTTPTFVNRSPIVRFNGALGGPNTQFSINDVKLDIFSANDKDIIYYDAPSQSYKTKANTSTGVGFEMSPFHVDYVDNSVAYPLPVGFNAIMYMATGTGQVLDPTAHWRINAPVGNSTNYTFSIIAALPIGTSKLFGQSVKV